jgi:spermidine synthase
MSKKQSNLYLIIIFLVIITVTIFFFYITNNKENFRNINSESLFSNIIKKYSGKNNDTDGSDKGTSHSYDKIYDTLFVPYKNTATSILEIGIRTGAALNGYSEYFNNANIYGIDIEDQILPQYKNIPRTNIYFGDALNTKTINHFNTTYDIIIEDGSHLIKHQIQHFKDFSKFIKPGGIYIIEDVKSNDFYELLQSTHEKSKELDFDLVIYDLRNNKGRDDDILFVFRKIIR